MKKIKKTPMAKMTLAKAMAQAPEKEPMETKTTAPKTMAAPFMKKGKKKK